jgi:hypothetical protein
MASASSTPQELLARWEELSNDETVPYPLQLLAEEFGYTNLQLLQTRMRRLGVDLPRLRTVAYERDHAIGEITFLRSAGQGVAQIASQLGWTVDQLVGRVHDWYHDGLIPFNYNDSTWRLEEEQWKSAEFAIGPKARNGRAGQLAFKHSAA